ncbi:uncharacterized protein LOC129592534 [Paramacrobiotus metropolitanus]|uniref:uncharacterized protein LOC129592534 n=1 Tax=Paramacrobiotus metropolitanus TaxID=2943436 RepID=UPI002445F064|nr:uncharacterized protein LOC129592534 [Paramacrobiotus metropolitanus]
MQLSTSKIMLNELYYSGRYVKFTVDVVRDDVIQRGYITDIVDGGLIIDFHHEGPSATQLVEFSCIRALPTQHYAAKRYRKPPQINSDVEVLIRVAVDQPLTWKKATFLALLPGYENNHFDIEGDKFALVRLQSRNPFSLVGVINLWPEFVASDIRIRQKRLWQTVTPETFYKVTVSYASYSCHKTDCPFPRSPLLDSAKQLDRLDAVMKWVWLNMTGTLILSADDASVTVLCRQKAKRLPNKFHRLVFHLYDRFVEQYVKSGGTFRMETWFTKTIRNLLFFPNWLASKSNVVGALVSARISQGRQAFPAVQTLSDEMLLEVLQNMDRAASRDLKRVCRRWSRIHSTATMDRCVILYSPGRRRDHLVYLVNAVLQYTAVSTRTLLMKHSSPSHSSTTIRLLKEMQLQLDLYVSYRSEVPYSSHLCEFYDEMALYPAVNNLHIFCSMKSKSAERLTLEMIMASPDEIKWLLSILGGGWTYCCTTQSMSDTLRGISCVLDALNCECLLHGKLSEAVDYCNFKHWDEEVLKDGLQCWPISPATLEVLLKGFEDYYPSSETALYCKISQFRLDHLKVLIRKPRMVGEDYFRSCGVQSWFRFT